MQTPLMKQYFAVKKAHPDTIILFRVGDFYETFEEDAKIASHVLGITLTKRSNGAAGDVPLAGFPYHAVNTYLPKLVRAGYRVGICEQTEDPAKAKGLVKREVIEVVTSGVAFSDQLLDHKKNNYLLAFFERNDIAGIAFTDASTGEFRVFEVPASQLYERIEQIAPAEILVQKRVRDAFSEKMKRLLPETRISRIDDFHFQDEYAAELLTLHFQTKTLKGFGIEHLANGIIAASVVLHYLQETQKTNLTQITSLARYNPSDFMYLDASTKRNLEIMYSMQDGTKAGTLFSVIDHTVTPMGGRLLKHWITLPLRRLEPILRRHAAVAELVTRNQEASELAALLRGIGDLERLTVKICTARSSPRDLAAVRNTLVLIPKILAYQQHFTSAALTEIFTGLSPLEQLVTKLESALVDSPPLTISDGGIIRTGFSVELDELRSIAYNGKDWIANYQKKQREATGIPSLRVSYNKVFGYYIEITNANKDKVPQDYIRKQTLVNGERFITPELKVYEEKVLSAEDKIFELESQLVNEVRLIIAEEAQALQRNASFIANLDVLCSFAAAAVRSRYVQPVVTEGNTISITDGRHPVLEQILPPGEKYTPNDCFLDDIDQQIIVLTGPNMAGKSVYLRQVGLIVLLAQCGSFVPAAKAEIGLVDRIFTRVGAGDNIAAGESTFLVEMQEAANILNNATPKSLLLFDEIGRGTSTFDGMSIAWAITEFLHENAPSRAKTLFATHYHELNELADIYARIKNYKVDVREFDDKVIFLHKVSLGSADHSYGIQVAMMAGLPYSVTTRAKELLITLEKKELTPYEEKQQKRAKNQKSDGFQLTLFEVQDDALRKEIDSIEIDNLTPVAALQKLNDLQKKMREK